MDKVRSIRRKIEQGEIGEEEGIVKKVGEKGPSFEVVIRVQEGDIKFPIVSVRGVKRKLVLEALEKALNFYRNQYVSQIFEKEETNLLN